MIVYKYPYTTVLMFVECGTGYEGLGFAVDIVGGKIPKTLLFVFFSPLEGKKSTCKF